MCEHKAKKKEKKKITNRICLLNSYLSHAYKEIFQFCIFQYIHYVLISEYIVDCQVQPV